MTVKRRLKLKKKNFLILCVILFLITDLIINIPILFTKKDVTTINKPKNNTLLKKGSYEEKLKKLNYINKQLDYFKEENIDRYLNYKKKNPNLSNKEIIINVNIGLDYNYYENAKQAKNLNNTTLLVNKYNYLESNYIPNNLEEISIYYANSGLKLVREAKEAYTEMAQNALKDGMTIVATSAYRSYSYQESLYNNYSRTEGKEKADTYSGRPGYSEHQTGLAIDLYNGKEDYNNFENTKEYVWMQDNAYKYGFILRFPKDKEEKTGYIFESWHYRYVGKKIAKYMYERNLCFEEYYAMFLDK